MIFDLEQPVASGDLVGWLGGGSTTWFDGADLLSCRGRHRDDELQDIG
jgi:hypothetical protein